MCYAFAFLCNDVTGCPAPSLLSPSKLFTPSTFSGQSGSQHALETLKKEVGWPGVTGLLNTESVLGTLAWYGLSLLLYVVLPASEVEGVELRTGGRLKYRFNCERRNTLTWMHTLTVLSLYLGFGHRRYLRGRDLGSWS